jgi:pimeloyl-ACP methyl ester carboxylesterase
MFTRAHARGTKLVLAAIAVALASTLAAAGAASAHSTIWLCKPSAKHDPCAPGLSTTLYNPPLTKPLRVTHPSAQHNPPIDCFYVYPTVSAQKTGNANLNIQPVEKSIALYQASRYSQYCRVFAPMYRQVTLDGIGLGKPTTKPNSELPLKDVTAALRAYLKHYNHGRGFVLIGHSQGSFVLRSVIAKVIDPNPKLRKLLVSAILMGGNVVVKGNTGIGGDFKHIPACRSKTQLGCVIAFSTFDQPVPNGSLFGHPAPLAGEKLPKHAEVLCTNPASLAGGSGLLDSISPSAPFAPHSPLAAGIKLLGVDFPEPSTVYWATQGAYSAKCVDSNGAHVLMIKARHGAPTPKPSPTAGWGLHLLDANIALGNLIAIVHAEAKAFVKRH